MLLIIQTVQVSNVKFEQIPYCDSLRKLSEPTRLYMSQNIWLKNEINTTVVHFVAFPVKIRLAGLADTPGDHIQGAPGGAI